MKTSKVVALALLGSFGLLAAIGWLNRPTQYAMRRTIDAVKLQLRDPDSAKFPHVWVSEDSYPGFTERFICGGVNAKNAFGGYVGVRPFIAPYDHPTQVMVGGSTRFYVHCLSVGVTDVADY